jgi:hypothetical protein
MMLEVELQLFRKKQEELGLSEEDCYEVVMNLSQFYKFSEQQCELMEFMMDLIESRRVENEHAS